MKKLICVVLLIFVSASIQAQEKCGSQVSAQSATQDYQTRVAFGQKQLQNLSIQQKSSTLQSQRISNLYNNPNVVFDVVVHIPFTSTIAESTVRNSFCNLNQKFAPIGIQFNISEFRYDGNGISNLLSGYVDGSQTYLNTFDVSNKINLYIPATMFDDGASSFPFDRTTQSGFTLYKSSRIIVRANRFTSGNGSTIPHEFGHFFGLYHTHQEKDGSNCSEQGDLVCDTPYDSGTRTSTCYFDSNCNWVNGGNCSTPSAPFPLGNNFMALVVDQFAIEWTTCRNFFTRGQYARMLESYYVYSSSFFNQFTRSSLPFSISGNDIVCSTGTTYSIPAQSGATSYSWRLMQDNTTSQSAIINGGNSTLFIPSTTSVFNGFVEARVNYSNGACLYAVKWVSGLPSSSLLSVSGQGMTVTSSGLALAPIYNGSLITSTPNSQDILQAEWASNSSSVTISQSGITATAFPANGCVGGVASLRVRVRNCAGWSSWYLFTVNVCSFSGFRFVYSPNPTSDVLDITAVPTEENKNLSLAAEINFEVKLMDKYGRVVREGKNSNKEKKITLDVKGLKEGTYFLHIAHGKELEKHQILIRK